MERNKNPSLMRRGLSCSQDVARRITATEVQRAPQGAIPRRFSKALHAKE